MRKRAKTPEESELMMAMGDRLRKAREKALGLKQKTLAARMDISKSTQNEYENAVWWIPIDYLWKLETELEITASYIVTGSTVGLGSAHKKSLTESDISQD